MHVVGQPSISLHPGVLSIHGDWHLCRPSALQVTALDVNRDARLSQVGLATVGIFIYWYCFDESPDGSLHE